MSEGAPDPDEAMLSRLAELDLAAAEKAHARLMAAEEAAEIAELGRTYQRLARSLRQTLALKAKLKHDRERALSEAVSRPPSPAAIARRVREVRDAVTRVIWDEAEEVETGEFCEEMLESWLSDMARQPGFAAEPLDEQVVEACAQVGLSTARARDWRNLPDPDAEPPNPPAEPQPHRSSA